MSQATNTYHIPVMLEQCIEHLNIKPDGIYVDFTFGGGGHSKAILNKLSSKGRLFAFDQDKDALKNKPKDERLTLFHENFCFASNFLKLKKITQVDGILADLGISSYQIDQAEKGFSTRFDASLDMRMDQRKEFNATALIETYSEEALQNIFYSYGEIENSKKLARTIIQARAQNPITSTTELSKAIESCHPPHKKNKYLAKVFQAIRIEVNKELEVLEKALIQCEHLLKEQGKLVIMSYHSLEDRLVKNYLRFGHPKATEAKKDFYGNIIRPFTPFSNKVIVASEQEINSNPRAKSAKLRIGTKNA